MKTLEENIDKIIIATLIFLGSTGFYFLAKHQDRKIEIVRNSPGEIIEKIHQPEEIYERSGGMVGFTAIIGGTFVDDEDFIIIYKNKGGFRYAKDHRLHVKHVYLNKEIYDSLNVGNTFDPLKTLHEKYDFSYRVR